MGFVGLLLCIFFLPLQIKIWSMQGELARLKSEHRAFLQEQAEVRAELKYYASDSFVEEAARRELGLVKPGEVLILPAVPGRVQPPPKNHGKEFLW